MLIVAVYLRWSNNIATISIIEKIIYNLSLNVFTNKNFIGPNCFLNVLLSIKR